MADYEIRDVDPKTIEKVAAMRRNGPTAYEAEPGDYPDLIWPADIDDFPCVLRPASRKVGDEARFAGLMFGTPDRLKGNFAHLTSKPSAKKVRNLLIDGILVSPQAYDQARDQSGKMRSTDLADGPIAWRVCGTDHPAAKGAHYSEQAGIRGLQINGADGVEITNVRFENCAIQLSLTDISNVAVRFCTFARGCEDLAKFAGFNGLIFECNAFVDGRPMTAPIASVQGWGNSEPPHRDALQQMGTGNGVSVLRNLFDDKTGLMHGGLFRTPQGRTGRSRGLVIIGNRLRIIHPTGFLIDDYDDVDVESNWITSIGPAQQGGPVLNVNRDTIKGKVVFRNNQSPRLFPSASNAPSGWNVGGNIDGSRDQPPAGWVEIEKGDKIAGRYGATGGHLPDGSSKPTDPTVPPKPTEPPVDTTPPVDEPGRAELEARAPKGSKWKAQDGAERIVVGHGRLAATDELAVIYAPPDRVEAIHKVRTVADFLDHFTRAEKTGQPAPAAPSNRRGS